MTEAQGAQGVIGRWPRDPQIIAPTALWYLLQFAVPQSTLYALPKSMD